MEIAIVTGAVSGIGLAVSKTLIARGCVVYGLARNVSNCEFEHERFVLNPCDISNHSELKAVVQEILKEAGQLHILVNNAGVGYFGPHETIHMENLEEMVKTNLLAPMVLTHATLRRLRDTQGAIINIASTAAVAPHRFGAVYGATKAGLLQFGESLFEEVRKSGVRVVTLLPDMTITPFYDNASFAPADDPMCHITPSCVAEGVEMALSQRQGTVVSQIVLKPQRIQVKSKVSRS